MASSLLKRVSHTALKSISSSSSRSFAAISTGSDIFSVVPAGVTLQKARSWDEGVSSKFSTTPIEEIFKDKQVVIFGLPGAYTGVCSKQHVPSYIQYMDRFIRRAVHSVICVSVNDPYTLNAWADKLGAKEAGIEFYADFDGSFHKSLELDKDLSAALLGHRSERWSAYIVYGKVRALNIEKDPSDFRVSSGFNMSTQV